MPAIGKPEACCFHSHLNFWFKGLARYGISGATFSSIRRHSTINTPSLASNNRQTLRRELRHQRRLLTDKQKLKAADQVCEQISRSGLLAKIRSAAAYLPVDNELDLRPTLQILIQRGAHLFLPRLSTLHKHQMQMWPWHGAKTPMRNNRFGIPEPIQPGPRASERFLSAVFLPLLGVDKNGNRLGMGGGFYDRWLERVEKQSKTKPILIACAYPFQIVEKIHAEAHDVPVDYILSPNEIISTHETKH